VISFSVLGIAQTAGSKRAFPFKRKDGRLGVAVSDNNPRAKDWKATVAWAAREAVGSGFVPLRCALEVEFTFYRVRPQSHKVGKGGPNKSWREHPFPTSRPDALKLARGCEDALQGVLYLDDSQIVTETLRKRWGEAPRVEITIKEAE
jgi:Holliday junction resolvase RusA-like endonuclease